MLHSMNHFLTRVFKQLRGQQRQRAKDLRARTDSVRKKLTAHSGAWESADVIRSIRDGR